MSDQWVDLIRCRMCGAENSGRAVENIAWRRDHMEQTGHREYEEFRNA